MNEEQKYELKKMLEKYNINSRNVEIDLINFIDNIIDNAYQRGIEATEEW